MRTVPRYTPGRNEHAHTHRNREALVRIPRWAIKTLHLKILLLLRFTTMGEVRFERITHAMLADQRFLGRAWSFVGRYPSHSQAKPIPTQSQHRCLNQSPAMRLVPRSRSWALRPQEREELGTTLHFLGSLGLHASIASMRWGRR